MTIHLDDDHRAAQFARGFLATYLAPSLGAVSKSETDQLVFRLLVEAGELTTDGQVYEIARALNVTPSKARNLLFQWQLRQVTAPDVMRMEIAKAISHVRFASDRTYLVFGIESPLVREELRSRFKKMGVFTDATFSPEIIRVKVEHFVEFMDGFLEPAAKKSLTNALVKDRQIEDRSFKGVATKVIEGFAQKAVGKGADALVGAAADALGPFVKALFLGDSNRARQQAELVLA